MGTDTLVGIVGLCCFVCLMLIGMPIAIVMILVGFLGFASLSGWKAAFSLLSTEIFSKMGDFTLGVIPLFTAMGYIAMHFGLSKDLFYAANRLIGHWRGGIAMATTVACAMFGAICGTSIGVAAAVGAVALPEMRRFGYDDKLATGLLASAGNIGFLIPPSLVFVIYAILTEQSIGILFIAGVLPGILLTGLFILTIWFWCKVRPELCACSEKLKWKERVCGLKYVSPTLLVVGFVLAGIYLGIFTPTEAAALGVLGVIMVGLAFKRFSYQRLIAALKDTALLTGKLYLLIVGAMIFARFTTVSEIALNLSLLITKLHLSREAVLLFMIILYIATGFFLDVIPIVMITAPIFHYTMVELGYDPVWLSVVVVMTILIGQITPPFGINVFALAGMVKDVPVSLIFRGVWPFILATILCLAIVVLVPPIATYLPTLMLGG